jgi:hypothetical protein
MARRARKNTSKSDLLDYPIVNGVDADRGELFLMWFDAHAPLHLLVWADHFEDAFEYAVDYLDDEGKCGVFTFFDESDYKAAAEDEGIGWPEDGMRGLSERDAQTVQDATEVDHTIIGHTQLKCQKGQYSAAFVAHDDWGGGELHGDDVKYIRAWSLASDDQAEDLHKLGWKEKSAEPLGMWTAPIGDRWNAVFYDERATYALDGGNGKAVKVEIYEDKGTAPIKTKKFVDGMGSGSVGASDPMLWVDEVEEELEQADED